jgi:hypothetical protein
VTANASPAETEPVILVAEKILLTVPKIVGLAVLINVPLANINVQGLQVKPVAITTPILA